MEALVRPCIFLRGREMKQGAKMQLSMNAKRRDGQSRALAGYNAPTLMPLLTQPASHVTSEIVSRMFRTKIDPSVSRLAILQPYLRDSSVARIGQQSMAVFVL